MKRTRSPSVDLDRRTGHAAVEAPDVDDPCRRHLDAGRNSVRTGSATRRNSLTPPTTRNGNLGTSGVSTATPPPGDRPVRERPGGVDGFVSTSTGAEGAGWTCCAAAPRPPAARPVTAARPLKKCRRLRIHDRALPSRTARSNRHRRRGRTTAPCNTDGAAHTKLLLIGRRRGRLATIRFAVEPGRNREETDRVASWRAGSNGGWRPAPRHRGPRSRQRPTAPGRPNERDPW